MVFTHLGKMHMITRLGHMCILSVCGSGTCTYKAGEASSEDVLTPPARTEAGSLTLQYGPRAHGSLLVPASLILPPGCMSFFRYYRLFPVSLHVLFPLIN